MSAFIDLSPEVERALRQLGSQSTSITPKAGHLLVRLALAVPYRDGWRLTPFGHRRYQALPKSLLQGRQAPPVIDNILDRAIPAARAAGIFSPMQSTANLETPSEALHVTQRRSEEGRPEGPHKRAVNPSRGLAAGAGAPEMRETGTCETALQASLVRSLIERIEQCRGSKLTT